MTRNLLCAPHCAEEASETGTVSTPTLHREVNAQGHTEE